MKQEKKNWLTYFQRNSWAVRNIEKGLQRAKSGLTNRFMPIKVKQKRSE